MPILYLERFRWRKDGRCGVEYPLDIGSPSQCNPKGYKSCCSADGNCGSTKSHCSCTSCIDYRKYLQKYPKWRTDKRCGENYPLPNGRPTECEPGSEYPCCSNYGYCGASVMHCACAKCVNYGKPTSSNLWRSDLKCGWRYPLSTNKVTQCNPKSGTPCCSASGICGATTDHCSCLDCVDYRKESLIYQRWRTDKLCGDNYPLRNGRPTECDPDSRYPCCSNHGFCGASKAHCLCNQCVDYRRNNIYIKPVAKIHRCGQNYRFYNGKNIACDPDSDSPCCSNTGICGATISHCLCEGCIDSRDWFKVYPKWRDDKRCGRNYPLPFGKITECDPRSDQPCCSSYGFCGSSKLHCLCKKCIDYRIFAIKYSKWRNDDRCGDNYPLPNKQPTQCDPDSNIPCCSNNGFCGRTKDHCLCDSCIDYRKWDEK